MGKNTKLILIAVAAVLVLVWGFDMKDADKSKGYSDETTYFSKEELEAKQKVLEEMAKQRGETPKPTATPQPEKEKKEEKLDARFEGIELVDVPQSFTLSRAGYDPEQQIMLAEFNMTGLVYAFYDVPEEEWVKLCVASDYDKWFDYMIMKKFKFEQLN